MTLLTHDHTVPGGSPRVRLEPIRHRGMVLDGCWWPRTHDTVPELSALVPALDSIRGPVVRLLLSAEGWTRRPHRLVLDDRTVNLAYFAGQPPTMLTAICADGGVVTVLVVPPESATASPDERAGGPTPRD